jgi:hypothetical protein
MKLEHSLPKSEGERYGPFRPNQYDAIVIARHHKVAEIINRHLELISKEVLSLDEETMNIDAAGDQAEIARQVLTALVERLRGFASGSRQEKDDE